MPEGAHDPYQERIQALVDAYAGEPPVGHGAALQLLGLARPFR